MNLFTSEELYVLAALMGRDFIIGVEGKTLETNRSNLKELYKDCFFNLEARGVFEYKIDGTLLVDREVKSIIKVLNKADGVTVVYTDINGILEKTSFLKYADEYCRLIDRGTSYEAESINYYDIGSLLNAYGIKFSSDSQFKCTLPISSLVEIGELYNSFNQNEADCLLSELVPDKETMNLIRPCLLMKNRFFVLKEYKRIGNHMVVTENLLLRFAEDYILKFVINDGINVDILICQKENKRYE